MKINETRVKVRKLVLEACYKRGLKVVTEAGAPEAQPTLQGVHPLIDGMYEGNGSSPSVLRRVPAAVEIMKANPEVEEFKLTLSIVNNNEPVPYLPFGFEAKLSQALAKAGADPKDVEEVSNFGMYEDDEYNPPGW